MERLCQEAVHIFKAAVRSVKPETLVEKVISVSSQPVLHVCNTTYSLSQNVYVVGFGKAVYGMAVAIDQVIGSHLVSGIISVPKGFQKQNTNDWFSSLKHHSKIQVFEGGVNNMPDADSMAAAIRINNLASSLKETDILFVLVSGGGSALLPIPGPGLTVEDKMLVAKALAAKGASVQEINTIRKQLSLVKGGQLALTARPSKVVSLILSDIVGDPLDLIASGPTIKNSDSPDKALGVLQKYDLLNSISTPVLEALRKASKDAETSNLDDFGHVKNVLIGCNRDALYAAFNEARILQFVPVILTSELEGSARLVGQELAVLVDVLQKGEYSQLDALFLKLKVPHENKKKLVSAVEEAARDKKYLCLLFGGETVVEVKGSGTGGRNQELALSASIQLKTMDVGDEVVILSAGTDGIDGPTTAAGAIATPRVFEVALKEGLDPVHFLKSNDSFNFYNKVNNGEWHIITGHTGTNVMDIIIVLLKCPGS